MMNPQLSRDASIPPQATTELLAHLFSPFQAILFYD
jgi:hypothetical protein